jgi:CheY-like chemotaxis protein
VTDAIPRILLVEDDEGDAILVRECLSEAGGRPDDAIWVRTLAEAVTALGQRPSCVLLDLGLPDAEGLSALHALVAVAGNVPVIVLTGRNDRGFGEMAVAAGAQDFLVKDDITAYLLERAVRYAVGRRRAQIAELELRAEQLRSAENARLERGLLPNPRLRSDLVSCTTYYRPGSDLAVLGGDFFDVVETADGRVRAVIGDVMGHGPDEAALGVHLRVAWRTLVLAGTPDYLIFANLARLLSAETGNTRGFVTACDVTIDHQLGAVVRVAGHPAPLICRDARTSYLTVEIGPPLGVEGLSAATRRWTHTGGWPETRVSLGPNVALVLYTDGLLDAYRVSSNDASIGLDELVVAADARLAAGSPVAVWMPGLVDGAPARSDDDTAVVVLTTRAAAAG